ncbi:MAG: 50S ribosomal protein L25/general stress protein Ctc [Pseudomonadota bacterium]
MSKQYAIQAEKRDGAGKGAARALRRDNKIPAVIYGDGKAPVTIAMPMKEANLEYNKGHMFTTLCDLDLGGEKHLVLARDVQLHPVTDNVMHVDFLRVNAKTTIKVNVPVDLSSYEDSPAAKEKGVLNITRHDVELVCQATAIPDSVVVDASAAEIGDSLKSTNATLPDGAAFAIDDREFTIATVTAPKAFVEEEVEGEGEEGAEGEEGEAKEGEEAKDGEGGDAEGEKKDGE